MWPYWLMFLLPAVAAFTTRWSPPVRRASALWSAGWIAAAFGFALAIGYRHEVGGDWGAYVRAFYDGGEFLTDPGYRFINWAVGNLGGDIYEVNLVCGLVFSFCLLHFCRQSTRPWLALTVAVPYLVIVVGMGYTRQAVALAFAMLGLSMLQRNSTAWFVVWVLIGATFHKTAVLLLPIAALASSKNRYWSAAWVGVVAIFAYQVLLRDSAEEFYSAYVDADMQSEGALLRALMNAVPGTILLLGRKRFQLGSQRSLWLGLAAISVALPAMFLVTGASTAVDRMALYMLPLQVVVFAQVPDVLGKSSALHRQIWVAAVLLYYCVVQFTWLNFAVNAESWLPYRFYPLEAAT